MRVKCLFQEYNTATLAKAWTRATQSRVQRANRCHYPYHFNFYSFNPSFLYTQAIQENQHNLIISGVTKSQLTVLYEEHQERQETEEKLCKWTDADTLQAYEQELLNNGGKTVAELLDSWQNPVFTAPEKVRLGTNRNVQFQKISIPTPRKVIWNSEGEGVWIFFGTTQWWNLHCRNIHCNPLLSITAHKHCFRYFGWNLVLSIHYFSHIKSHCSPDFSLLSRVWSLLVPKEEEEEHKLIPLQTLAGGWAYPTCQHINSPFWSPYILYNTSWENLFVKLIYHWRSFP